MTTDSPILVDANAMTLNGIIVEQGIIPTLVFVNVVAQKQGNNHD